jgi:hypothetical protein
MFFQGDKVSYVGEKFRSDLAGKMGEICAPVVNQPDVFVVDFGSDDYIISAKSLTRFQGHLKVEDDKKSKEPRVEQRRRTRKQEATENE